MPKLTIDNVPVEVAEGTTILEAAKKIGVQIPTLCYLADLQAIGACRVCLVEVVGAKDLVASCVTPVNEGMKVHTHNQRVLKARRFVVELLLSEHCGDCQTCSRSDDCELQDLARTVGVKSVSFSGAKSVAEQDLSTPALVRDSGKCVHCRRCIAVCNEVQGVGALFPQRRGFKTVIGPAFCQGLDSVVCVQCGQCAAVCPVGAIVEKDCTEELVAELNRHDKYLVVQTAPAIRAALGECFGLAPGTLVTGKMVTALRRLGFDAVFDTDFAADVTIVEEGHELLARLRASLEKKDTSSALPMFTSCSPGWINFVENFYPDWVDKLSTCKSPQQMMGALVKSYYAKKIGRPAGDILVVSVMPCTAKKFEAQRPEMSASGSRDVDLVLTTRELGRLIKMMGIDFLSLSDGQMDAPLGLASGAADIFANTGGVMEAAVRTVYELVTGRPLPFADLHVQEVAGLKGIKEATLKVTGTLPEWRFLEGVDLRLAVAHGLGNARRLVEKIKSGAANYHFVEVMACPGGCIGGGGQPRMTDNRVREARIVAIYREDEGKTLRKSHENKEVQAVYREFLGEPLGKLAHKYLHTHYRPKLG